MNPPLPAAPLSLAYRMLHAPKDGNTEAQYEDAYAVADGTAASTPSPIVRAVVADGASSSIFARQWARLLAEAFSAVTFDETKIWAQIAFLGGEWRKRVSSESLPWYAQEKMGQGSHAALLIVAWDLAQRAWIAHAVGDTCLFLVRGGRLVNAFPMTDAAAFDNSPPLLSTETASRPAADLPTWGTLRGAIEPGDLFLLMSDALAAWFLSAAAAKKKPWEELAENAETFPAWLQTKRESGHMRNDDVTLIEVRVTE